MPGIERLPIVGVMGSGREEHRHLAGPLGRRLASLPVHLLNGGGSGVMAAVSRAFAAAADRAGHVIGILPCAEGALDRPKAGYPNPWIEIAIHTHLPSSGDQGEALHSRNAINVLSSDVVIVLPGDRGTASETRLAVRYARPLIGHFGERSPPPWWPNDRPRAASEDDVERFVRRTLCLG